MTIKTMEKALEALKQERDNYLDHDPEDGAPEYIYEAIRDLEFEVARQKQNEPVAVVVARKYEDGSHAGNHLEWCGRNEANDFPVGTKFYTAPQQRKPMTDEMIFLCLPQDGDLRSFARAIEAAHGIKE
jgi:hypothetical protein